MPDRPEHKTPKPLDEQAEFVLSDVDASAAEREPFEDIWEETEQNFLVRPYYEGSAGGRSTEYPLFTGNAGLHSDYAILKDPATHSAVMSIVSNIALSLFPEPGFINARRVGFEDILKAKVASSLIEYVFSMPHHFHAFVEWLLSAGIYGTGWLEGAWEYKECPQTLRTQQQDPITGEVYSTFETLNLPEYDDIRFRPLSLWDVYPASGTRSPVEIHGVTKRFKMTARQAESMADGGTFDAEAVQRAIEGRAGELEAWRQKRGDETGLSTERLTHPDFMELEGFERFGEVPYGSEDGFNRRVVTLLGGETVRSDPWARKLPLFPMNIIPRHGSPYGISPAEVIRYDQDLADVLKMMIADAVVRGTHTPQIYEEGANVDLAALRQFKLDRPIKADRTDAVRQLDYRPPVDGAMTMYGLVSSHIKSGSAEGAFQGQAGPDRESATGFAGRLQQASRRPELFNVICERVWLPPVGTYTLKLYQEMLDDDPEELRKRVGESEGTAVSLQDIMADFDIRFVGTRIEGNKHQELQAFREIVAAGNHPVIGQLTPWMPLIQKYFERAGSPELAAMVGNPELMQMNVLLNRVTLAGQQAGNGNGNTAKAAQNPSQLPAQAEGGIL